MRVGCSPYNHVRPCALSLALKTYLHLPYTMAEQEVRRKYSVRSGESGGVRRELREDSSKSTPSNAPSNELSIDTNSTQPPQTSVTPRTPFTPTAQSPAPAHFRIPASPRGGASAMTHSESSTKAAKVAIPRLKRALDSVDGGNKPGGRHRVTHACEPCRHRKTKCSGERPVCRHCQDFKIQCYYADGKRDRVKK